jgi:hypothetical protein
MLRLLVLLLLLANGAFFAWSKGLLAPYGFAPTSQSEPQRLEQQIRPETIRILNTPGAVAVAAAPAASASSPVTGPSSTDTSTTATTSVGAAASVTLAAASAAASPAECLQVGIFNEEQTVVLRERLQSVLPEGSWVLESAVEPALWMVYMGKYSSAEALAKKRAELRQLRVSFAPLNNPALEPGLSLGTFTSQPEANAELERIAKRGVRTAKVVQQQLEVRGQKLRLPAVNAGLRPKLDELKPQLAGKSLLACQ